MIMLLLHTLSAVESAGYELPMVAFRGCTDLWILASVVCVVVTIHSGRATMMCIAVEEL